MKINRDTKAIYVIENMDNGRIKIGVSNNPKQRVNSLMLQGGCLMSLRFSSHFIDNYKEVERDLHAMFIDSRYVGEWFNLNLNEAIKSAKRMVRNRHDCVIIRNFEDGKSITNISNSLDVSRTAIVNYLHSKGYRPKDRRGKQIVKSKYVCARPHESKPIIDKSKLELMVEINNRKSSEKRKLINR